MAAMAGRENELELELITPNNPEYENRISLALPTTVESAIKWYYIQTVLEVRVSLKTDRYVNIKQYAYPIEKKKNLYSARRC